MTDAFLSGGQAARLQSSEAKNHTSNISLHFLWKAGVIPELRLVQFTFNSYSSNFSETLGV